MNKKEIMNWAEREVDLAMEKVPDFAKDSLNVAETAFRVILEHENFDLDLVDDFLHQLLKLNPITTIEDVPENWNPEETCECGDKIFLSNRKPGLFKREDKDGKVYVTDIDRYRCFNQVNMTYYKPGPKEHVIYDKIVPYSFPYYMSGKITFLVDKITDYLKVYGLRVEDCDYQPASPDGPLYFLDTGEKYIEVSEEIWKEDVKIIKKEENREENVD